VVATNVANASTPGYVRRSVLLAENVVAGSTSGVRTDGIARSQNEAITAERRNLTSDLAQSDVLSSTWRTISSRVGDTADGNGLFRTFANFESALSNLALTPESSADASVVLNSAKAIVQEFHSLSQLAVGLRTEADREIAQGRDVVNSALKTIEQLNGKISSMDRTTGEAAALIDERSRVLDMISEYLPVKPVPRNYGMIDIVTPEGVFLLAGTARQVEFAPSSAFGPDQTVDNGALSGLSVDGISLTPGSSSYGAVSSGLFGALFTLRDQDLPAFSSQLDTLAEDLITRLSDDALDPTKTPGAPGLFLDSAGTGAPGLAARISINAAVDPVQGGATWRLRDGLGAVAQGPTGDSSILNAMLGSIRSVNSISSNGIQGAFSSTDMVAQFASLSGQKRVQNETVLSSISTQHTMMLDAEQAENGVDVDAQMQELILIEQAYAANARVIEIASQMINRLMEI
jgi:flagellar hook-associated protein 1 FlgK